MIHERGDVPVTEAHFSVHGPVAEVPYSNFVELLLFRSFVKDAVAVICEEESTTAELVPTMSPFATIVTFDPAFTITLVVVVQTLTPFVSA
jgi:hypothetical protein